MTIVNFTPFSALFGGAIIGLAAALLFHFKGRIAGISGIFGGLFSANNASMRGDIAWRVFFIGGLILGGFIWMMMGGDTQALAPVVSSNWIVVAGLLVGVGTTLGTGCTSGHGICGISRFSVRSMASTATFMASGFAIVFVIRHLFA
jgi:uncharacterized protein